jgi:hypothetical protein
MLSFASVPAAAPRLELPNQQDLIINKVGKLVSYKTHRRERGERGDFLASH